MPELVSVPDVDGVPAVAFAAGFSAGIPLATGDVSLPQLFGLAGPRWGIFRNGSPVVVSDNVVAFDHKADWAISNYPIERGSFESFNKVKVPYDCRLVFTAGGNEANRAALLNSLRAIIGDLNLYDAVTPEATYTSVNLVHLDYRRTGPVGNGLIAVSVWCQEVRITAPSTNPSATGGVGDTASPSGADQANGGPVQSSDATSGQAASANVGDTAYAGGYDVSGYSPGGNGTLGDGTFQLGTDFGAVGGINTPEVIGEVGELTVQDGVTGEVLMAPSTTSSISGLQAAGPDQYRTFGVAP